MSRLGCLTRFLAHDNRQWNTAGLTALSSQDLLYLGEEGRFNMLRSSGQRVCRFGVAPHMLPGPRPAFQECFLYPVMARMSHLTLLAPSGTGYLSMRFRSCTFLRGFSLPFGTNKAIWRLISQKEHDIV